MNHLIISREYPPNAYPTGGIGTYVARMAGLLAECGETVHVIGEQWAGAPMAEELAYDGRLVVHRVPLADPLPSTAAAEVPRARQILDAMAHSDCTVQAFSWQAALLAESLVETARIDCIEGQDYEAPLYYFLRRRASGSGPRRTPPCFVHAHSPTQFVGHYNDWEFGRPAYLMLKRLEDYVIQGADAVLCPSLYLTRQVEHHYGLPPGSVERIPLPIGQTECLDRTAHVWAHGTVCCVGRLEPRKGVFEWIDAIVTVVRQRPGLRFEMIGADTDLSADNRVTVGDALAARLPEDVKPAVSFIGQLSKPDLQVRLAAARIVVVPSRWENFPNTCLEAMASGVPVLSSPNGGMLEMVVDGVTGWIADSGRPDALASALRRALDTPPEAKAAMGAAAVVAIRELCGNETILARQMEFRGRLAAKGASASLTVPRGFSSLVLREPAKSVPPFMTEAARASSKDSQLTTAEPPSSHGIAIFITCCDGEDIGGLVASLLEQTQPVAVVAVIADMARDEGRRRAERLCVDAGLPVLAAGDSGTVMGAVRVLLASSFRPIGVAVVQAASQLAPRFVECVERQFLRHDHVGLVSTWAEVGERHATLVIDPAPQRPYQWVLGDAAVSRVFRIGALRAMAWMSDEPNLGMAASTMAMAVLLEGWSSVTVPEVLLTHRGARRPLHEAQERMSRSHLVPALERRYRDQMSADALEVLSVASARLNALEQQVDEQRRWIAELEAAKGWLDSQRSSWESIAHRQEQLLADRASWIENLEQAKHGLSEERRRWRWRWCRWRR